MKSNYESKIKVKESHTFSSITEAFLPLIGALDTLGKKTAIFRNGEWQLRFAESIANSL